MPNKTKDRPLGLQILERRVLLSLFDLSLTFENSTHGFGSVLVGDEDDVLIGHSLASAGKHQSGSIGHLRDNNGTLAQISSPSPVSFGRFGSSMAILGDTAIVGEPGSGTGGGRIANLVDLETDTVFARLPNPTPERFDDFGRSVAIAERFLAVSDPFDDFGAADSGSVWVYDRNDLSRPPQHIPNPKPHASSQFGRSILLDENRLIVSVRSVAQDDPDGHLHGGVYVIDITSGEEIYPAFTSPNDPDVDTTGFGHALAMFGNGQVAIAEFEPTRQFAHVFNLNTGFHVSSLVSPRTAPSVGGDAFARSIAGNSQFLLVGAPTHSDSSSGSDFAKGRVYVFDADSLRIQGRLESPNPARNGRFGTAVGWAGDRVLVASEVVATSQGDPVSPAYTYVYKTEPPVLGLDRWWATAVVDATIDVKWTVDLPDGGLYQLDVTPDDQLADWRVIPDSNVIVDGAIKGTFNEFGRSTFVIPDGGIHEIAMTFDVPNRGLVESVEFSLAELTGFGTERLSSLFIADWYDEAAFDTFDVVTDAGILTGQSVDQLVDLFSPILHFTSDERYSTPMNVQTEIIDVIRGDGIHAGKSRGDADDFLDLSLFEVNLEVAGPGFYNPVDHDPAVYASVLLCQAQHTDCIPGVDMAISYNLFYPNSNWSQHKGANQHQADWEGYVVYLQKQGGNWVPTEISVAQHDVAADIVVVTNPSETAAWEDVNTPSTHPRLYVGLGGHATYLNRGNSKVLTLDLPNPLPVFRNELHDGLGVMTQVSGDNVHYLPRIAYEGNDRNVPSWLRFNGKWAAPSALELRPEGPAFSTRAFAPRGQRWLDPWIWNDGFERFVDSDKDGVTSHHEDRVNVLDDGNGDGQKDSLQADVTSLQSALGPEYVTLVTSDGVFRNVGATPGPDGLPDGVSLPVGAFQYEILGVGQSGGTVVTILLPDDVDVNSFYKFGPRVEADKDNPSQFVWYEFMFDEETGTGAEILTALDPPRINVHLKDGLLGDDDFTANGLIIDPGAPAFAGITSHVTASFNRKKLVISGDNGDNHVAVTQLGPDAFRITGRHGTAINGERGSIVLNGSTILIHAQMNGGNDVLSMRRMLGDDIVIARMGAGDDSYRLSDSNVKRLYHIDTGIGSDAIDITNVAIDYTVMVIETRETATVLLRDVDLLGYVVILIGDDNDTDLILDGLDSDSVDHILTFGL